MVIDKLIRIGAALCIITLLSACSTMGRPIPENPAVGELAPMMLPTYEVGQRIDFVNELTNDSEYWTVTDVSADGTVSATMSSGCKWKSAGAWFDGVGEWEECGTGDWSAAKSTAITPGPSLWPLQDGATANYKFETTNKVGKSDTHRRACEVSVVNIETSVGPLDAYKVVCKDDSGEWMNVRTWYFNPEHGELRFSRWTPNGGIRTNHKYL